MLHHYATRVARQTLRRFRGNARAVFENGLTRRVRVGQHRGVDVDHHLKTLSGCAWIDAVMQGRLREQRQRVGLLLRHRRRFRGNVERRIEGLPAALLV